MNDTARYYEASRNFPLLAVIIQVGKAPADLQLDTPFNCPFCEEKQCAYVFKAGPGQGVLFRCMGGSCRTENGVLNEIDFIALAFGYSEAEATEVFYREARARARKLNLQDEPLIEKSLELMSHLKDRPQEGNFTISYLQLELRIGFNRAARVMAILEQRGNISRFEVKPTRTILKLPGLCSAKSVTSQNSRASASTVDLGYASANRDDNPVVDGNEKINSLVTGVRQRISHDQDFVQTPEIKSAP